MKAAILYETQQPLRIDEVDIDAPGPREVLVRTGASGVCLSDLKRVEGRQHSETPMVVGHEAAGTVEAVGEQVTYVRPGDHVVTCMAVFCGYCDKCLRGRSSLCTNRLDTGSRRPGDRPRLSQAGRPLNQASNLDTLAEKMLVHENAIVKVCDDVPFDSLALIGCAVITGVGATLTTARVEPGSSVAVIGCGIVGLNCIQGAALAGALRIIAIDTVEAKLPMAREFGATEVVDASGGNVVQKVKDLTGGGVDYSFEAIGMKETAEQAYEMLDPGGTATVIGEVPEGTKIEIDAWSLLGERRLQGSNCGSNRFRIDIPHYIDLYLQGRLKLDELVSRRLRLEQVNEAFKYMKRGEVARSVITFD